MNFSKVLNHPDLQQIITKLTSGEPSRDVAGWLKDRYPNDRDKQISYNTLNEFRREQLNIHGAVLDDIKSQINKANDEDNKEELVKEIKKNKTYKEKLEEVIDQQIDWRYKLMQLLNVIETRFAQLFDKTQNNPENWKPDYVMISWMQTILEMIKEIRKVEGAPDQVVQHNVTIQTIDEQSALIQEALRQTLAEIDMETSLLLMDKISENLTKLKSSREQTLANERTFNKITENIDKLNTKILPAITVESEGDDNDEEYK
jgi:hypothetical protein